jgi:hypothetical protein
MNKSICICCQENVTEYFFHNLTAKDGNTIIICDSCYQEISKIIFLPNKKHLEVIEENGVKYYYTEFGKELNINWDMITE